MQLGELSSCARFVPASDIFYVFKYLSDICMLN